MHEARLTHTVAAIVGVLAVCAWVPAALAGAWTVERGRTEFQSTSTFQYGDHGFNEDGELIEVPEYRKFTLQSRVEYGVRSWLTGIAILELKEEMAYREVWRSPQPNPLFDPTRDPIEIVYGHVSQSLASVAAGARVRLLQTPEFVFSMQAIAGSGGFDQLGQIADDDGPEIEVRGLVGYGRELMDRPVFAEAQLGYRYRPDNSEADEVVLDLTVGARVLPRWLIYAHSFTTIAVDGDQHYTKVGASVVRKINERMDVELGGFGTVAGKNALQEFGAKVGVWYHF